MPQTIQSFRTLFLLWLATLSATFARGESWEQIETLVRDGDLAGAFAELHERPELAAGHEAAAETLRLTEAALRRTDTLKEAGLTESAATEISQLIAALEEREESPLTSALIDAVRKRQPDPEDGEALWELDFAERLIDAGRPDLALTKLDALLEKQAATLSRAQAKEAQRLMQRAEEARDLPAPPEWWQRIALELRKALPTLAEWLVYFLGLLLAVWLSKYLKYLTPPKRGVQLSVDDATAKAADRERQSGLLASDFATYVRKADSPQDGGERILSGMEGIELVSSAIVVGELANLENNIQPINVSVGPLQFNARELFRAFGSIFRRRYEFCLVGSLNESIWTTLTMEMLDARGRPVEGGVFSYSIQGAEARDEALRAVAAQVALHLSKGAAVTQDWKSLEHLLRAQDKLAERVPEDGLRASLEEAVKQLELALDHDQGNWVAHYLLAETFQKLGQYRSAADRYHFLWSRLAESNALKESGHLHAYLAEQPDFLWTLRYNEAVSRIRIKDKQERRNAQRMIQNLMDHVEDGYAVESAGEKTSEKRRPFRSTKPVSEKARRLRREILARSARAESLAVRAELARISMQGDAEREYIRLAVDQIKEDERWLWDRVSDLDRAVLTEYTYAHMVVRNALGRVHYLQGNFSEAAKFLRWSICFYGSAPNVEARANLASVYMKAKWKLAEDWIAEVQTLLGEVLQRNPQHSKANYLMGKLHSSPYLSNPERAKAYFSAAGDADTRSLFELGLLYARHEHDIDQGLERMTRALHGQLDGEYYRREFLYWLTARLDRDGSADHETLLLAERCSDALARTGKDRNQRRVEAYRKSLEGYQKRRREQESQEGEEEAAPSESEDESI